MATRRRETQIGLARNITVALVASTPAKGRTVVPLLAPRAVGQPPSRLERGGRERHVRWQAEGVIPAGKTPLLHEDMTPVVDRLGRPRMWPEHIAAATQPGRPTSRMVAREAAKAAGAGRDATRANEVAVLVEEQRRHAVSNSDARVNSAIATLRIIPPSGPWRLSEGRAPSPNSVARRRVTAPAGTRLSRRADPRIDMRKTLLAVLSATTVGTLFGGAPTMAEDAPQSFTLACTNNGGKTIYFTIDLSSRTWALMKANGKLDSEVQPVISETADFIKLKNPGGAFNVNRKTGAMELIKGETRIVDRIPCQKSARYIPLPTNDPPTNKF